MSPSWVICSGVRASTTWRRTFLTCPGAEATTLSQPSSVGAVLLARPSSGAGEALRHASVLQASYDVGQPEPDPLLDETIICSQTS